MLIYATLRERELGSDAVQTENMFHRWVRVAGGGGESAHECHSL